MSITNNQGEFYRRRVSIKQREQIVKGIRSEVSSFDSSNSTTSRKRTSALKSDIEYEYYINCLDMCYNNDIQSVLDTIKLFDDNETLFSIKFFQLSGEWLNTAKVATYFNIIGLDGQNEGLPKLKLSDLRKLQTNICYIFIYALKNGVNLKVSTKLLFDLFDEVKESIELFVLINDKHVKLYEITPRVPTILDHAENKKLNHIITYILEKYWDNIDILIELPGKYLEILIPFTLNGNLNEEYEKLWWNYIDITSAKQQKQRIRYLFRVNAIQRITDLLRETLSVCLELILKLIPLVDSSTEKRYLVMWDFIPEMWENSYELIIDVLSYMIDKKNGPKLIIETNCFPDYFDYLSRGLINDVYEAKFNQILSKMFVKGYKQHIIQLLHFKNEDGESCFLKYIRNVQLTNESYTKLSKIFYMAVNDFHKIDLSDFKEPEVNIPTVH